MSERVLTILIKMNVQQLKCIKILVICRVHFVSAVFVQQNKYKSSFKGILKDTWTGRPT